MIDMGNTYLKMSKAKEIQERWVLVKGQFAYHKKWKEFLVVDIVSEFSEKVRRGKFKVASGFKFLDKRLVDEGKSDLWTIRIAYKSDCIWIPRQDEIQDLLMNEGKLDQGRLLVKFYDFWTSLLPSMLNKVSIEQLWMCLYMTEIHKKLWLRVEEKWQRFKEGEQCSRW